MCVSQDFKFTTAELKRRVERLLRRGINMPADARLLLGKWVVEAEERLLDGEPKEAPQPSQMSPQSLADMALGLNRRRDQ